MRIQTSQKAELFGSAFRIHILWVFALFVCALSASLMQPAQAAAATSNTINFQARLETAAGAIVPDGTYNVEFKLYNTASTGGTAQGVCTGNCLWMEDYTYNSGSGGTDARIRVANGYLTVSLGSITSFPGTINWNQQLWLTMNIGGTVGSGSITWDGEMSPRIQLTAVPYAFQAGALSTTNGSNVATLGFTAPTATDSILLPDASGTVCLQSAAACGFAPTTGGTGYIQNGTTLQSAANFNIQSTSNTAVTGVFRAGSSQTADLLQFQNATGSTVYGGATVGGALYSYGVLNETTTTPSAYLGSAGGTPRLLLATGTAIQNWEVDDNAGTLHIFQPTISPALTIQSGGAITLQTATNTQTALQVENQTGASALTVDTNNLRVDVGTKGTPTSQLYVSGSVPTSALTTVATGTGPDGIYVQGRYLYVVNYTAATLQIFDVSNPASPTSVGTVATGTGSDHLYVQGHYVYVDNSGANTLQIFDVSNPASPTSVGTVATGTDPEINYVQGRYAYVADEGANTLQIFDVVNPASPVSVGSVATGTNPHAVYVQGRYAYVLNYGSNTLQIFDVSNPTSPTSVGSVATGSSPSYLYVQGRYAYVTNNTANTLQIFDVSNPASPASVGSVATGSGAHGLYVQGRFAYVSTATANTLQIFDVSNPASPTSVGSVATGAAPGGVYVQGRYAFVANTSGNTVSVFDVGGAYTQQLEVGGTETGTLQVDTNANIFGNQSVTGGLTVGQSAQLSGDLGVNGTAVFSEATASTTVGVVNLGSGGFGGGSGNFVGSSSGTELALNAPSGYAGNLADFQVNGTSHFLVDPNGQVIVNAPAGYSPTSNLLSLGVNNNAVYQFQSDGNFSIGAATGVAPIWATINGQFVFTVGVNGTIVNNVPNSNDNLLYSEAGGVNLFTVGGSGNIANVAGNTTAGTLGVPIVVAAASSVSVTSTALQTIVSYTTPAAGLYEVSGYVRLANGTSGNAVLLQVQWHDSGAYQYADFSTNGTSSIVMNAANSYGNGDYPAPPLFVYCDSGAALNVYYRDPTHTPADHVSAAIERLD